MTKTDCLYEWQCPDPTLCAAGSYSTNGLDYLGLGACKPCDAGKYSAAGASTCSDCQAGKYAAAGASTLCAHCQAGKISAAGASTCVDCPDGKTANALSTDCELKVSETVSSSNKTAAIVGGVVGGVTAILVCIAVMSLPY